MLWSIAGEKRDLLAQCQDFFMTDTTSKHSSPKLIKLFFQGGNFSLIFFYQRLLINNLQSINLKWFLPFGSHAKYISAIYKIKNVMSYPIMRSKNFNPFCSTCKFQGIMCFFHVASCWSNSAYKLQKQPRHIC